MVIQASGEYLRRGTYHRHLDPDWSYAPVYRRKMRAVRTLLDGFGTRAAILDAGCGEGVLVDEYRARGYCIYGVDRDYVSGAVLRGDLLALPFDRQTTLLREVRRVLRVGGCFVRSIPNLAHLSSRWKFIWTGILGRTRSVEYHPGDGPVHEYLEMLLPVGFVPIRRRGIFPTLPGLYQLVQRHPARLGGLVGMVEWVRLPGWCFLNILKCRAV